MVAEVSLSNGLGLAIKVFINNTEVIKFGYLKQASSFFEVFNYENDANAKISSFFGGFLQAFTLIFPGNTTAELEFTSQLFP